jgi:hypothetical protein
MGPLLYGPRVSHLASLAADDAARPLLPATPVGCRTAASRRLLLCIHRAGL